jgi:FkbM family methyltransferase
MSSPDIVLDIGANYGEIVISSVYPHKTRIYVFEPSPIVFPFLERSMKSHKNHGAISLIRKVVSDREENLILTVDRKWSGTSSAIGRINERGKNYKGKGLEKFEEIKVNSIVIDRFIQRHAAGPRANLLFKIDVEGFEGRVLVGMKNSLKNANSFTGIIEFDSDYLARAGTPPSAVLEYMKSLGAVFRVDKKKGITPVDHMGQLRTHNDLILTSDPNVCSYLSIPLVLSLMS